MHTFGAHQSLLVWLIVNFMFPVFEFDSNNDIRIHRDRVNSCANGVGWHRVGWSRIIPLLLIPVCLWVSISWKNLSRTIRAWLPITSIPCSRCIYWSPTSQRFVVLTEIRLKSKRSVPGSEVVGNDILDHKEVDSYTIPAGYDGDVNVARPTTYVTHITYYYTPRAHRICLIPELP